jgi:hypothetical protein
MGKFGVTPPVLPAAQALWCLYFSLPETYFEFSVVQHTSPVFMEVLENLHETSLQWLGAKIGQVFL